MHTRNRSAVIGAVMTLALAVPTALGETAEPPARQTVDTAMGFEQLVESLEQAVEANGMFVVTRACASCGAAKRGIEIPGNMVIGVFRNDFAVRMLEASAAAGIEAPIRFYVTGNADGTASLTWRLPSDVFAPYDGERLDALGAELDEIWRRIVDDAVQGG